MYEEKNHSWWSWVWPILLGLAVALCFRLFVGSVVKVDGPSMQPNLQNNERVFCWKLDKIKRGSVVVFNAYGVDPQATGKIDYVKRVIALPGDTVKSEDGKLYVNNKLVNQNYISKYQRDQGTGDWTLPELGLEHNWQRHQNSVKVPNGEYFVLGDHRSVSNDGRYIGFVPKSKILGVVKVPVWTSTETQRQNVNNQDDHFWKE